MLPVKSLHMKKSDGMIVVRIARVNYTVLPRTWFSTHTIYPNGIIKECDLIIGHTILIFDNSFVKIEIAKNLSLVYKVLKLSKYYVISLI